MTKPDMPRRVRLRPKGWGIPISTTATGREIGQLLIVWRKLRKSGRLRHARCVLGRLLTTKAVDL
ncbi:MAG TPA: hypothetical protein VFZ21_26030 [Gemmatimonadaceae bacterium]|nr:hypothetical protein [Gemmatimonadaceae bacterium]